jgi:hypothetical protein
LSIYSLWIHNICIWRLISPLLSLLRLHHNNLSRLLLHHLTSSSHHYTLPLKCLKIWLVLLYHHRLTISLLSHSRISLLSHSRLLDNHNMLMSRPTYSPNHSASTRSIISRIISTEMYPVSLRLKFPHHSFVHQLLVLDQEVLLTFFLFFFSLSS